MLKRPKVSQESGGSILNRIAVLLFLCSAVACAQSDSDLGASNPLDALRTTSAPAVSDFLERDSAITQPKVTPENLRSFEFVPGQPTPLKPTFINSRGFRQSPGTADKRQAKPGLQPFALFRPVEGKPVPQFELTSAWTGDVTAGGGYDNVDRRVAADTRAAVFAPTANIIYDRDLSGHNVAGGRLVVDSLTLKYTHEPVASGESSSDAIQHTGLLQYRHIVDPDLKFTLSLSDRFKQKIADPVLNQVTARPTLAWDQISWMTGTLYYEYDRYAQMNQSTPSGNQNGDAHGPNIGEIFLLNLLASQCSPRVQYWMSDLKVTTSYSHLIRTAEGRNIEKQVDSLLFDIQYTMPAGQVFLDAEYRHNWERYSNADALIGARRVDSIDTLAFSAVRRISSAPFIKHALNRGLFASIKYQLRNVGSNEATSVAQENLVTFNITWKF